MSMSAEHRCDMTSGPHVPHLKTAKQKRAQVHHSRKRWPSQAKRSWNYTHTPWKGRLLVLLPLLPVIEAAITALCSFHNIKVVVMLFFALEEVTSASMHQCLILCTQKRSDKSGQICQISWSLPHRDNYKQPHKQTIKWCWWVSYSGS